jgi:hypothetical protein
MKRTIIILALLAVAAVLAVVAAGGGGTPSGPPLASAQADFGVDGPDGKPIVCKNGKELRVKKELLLAKPPPPGQLKKEGNGKNKVWRCGPGPDPDKHPRLIDKAEDPLANPAG